MGDVVEGDVPNVEGLGVVGVLKVDVPGVGDVPKFEVVVGEGV